jgi:nucleotide-binding universal stress UspA family protein
MVFRHVLVPLDGSGFAEQAITHAGRIARAFDCHVTLLQVIDGERSEAGTGSKSIDWRLRCAQAESYLKSFVDDSRLAGIKLEIRLAEGRPADQIADYIARHSVNLIIMTAWGAGGETGFPYGGTAHKVLVSTGVSYLVVRDGTGPPDALGYKRILVPLDGSRKAELAAQVAVALDFDHQARIHFHHVICEPVMPRRRPLTPAETSLKEQLIECNRRAAVGYLDQLREQFGTGHDIQVRIDIAKLPLESIATICRQDQPDLMVICAHGDGELNGWNGESILQSMLATVDTPVLALQDGFGVPGP